MLRPRVSAAVPVRVCSLQEAEFAQRVAGGFFGRIAWRWRPDHRGPVAKRTAPAKSTKQAYFWPVDRPKVREKRAFGRTGQKYEADSKTGQKYDSPKILASAFRLFQQRKKPKPKTEAERRVLRSLQLLGLRCAFARCWSPARSARRPISCIESVHQAERTVPSGHERVQQPIRRSRSSRARASARRARREAR
jgi:hypothetical protein